MAKLIITTIADPMMGLLWETWPTMRKLETHYGDQVDLKFMPGQLVKNIYDLVDPKALQQYGKRVALNQYWVRLMQIYLQEEQIAGMPIYMGGNQRLFDQQHLSTIPLNQGWLAIAGDDSQLGDQVLYEMQYDTVVNDLQTNDQGYLAKLAQQFGVGANKFTRRFNSAAVRDRLVQSDQLRQQMQIDQLPAYLLTFKQKTYVVQGIPQYADWQKLIQQVTTDTVRERPTEFTFDAVKQFVDCHPHFSSLEVETAFGVDHQEVTKLLSQMKLSKTLIKGIDFYLKEE